MMGQLRLRFLIPALLFLVLAGVFAVYLYEVGPGGKVVGALPSALIGKELPAFSLPPIDGMAKGFSSADLHGKVALINVWASWCVPCRAEQPMLMRISREGVPIYGVNYKDKPADAKAFLTELGNPFTAVGADRNGRVSIDLGVYGYPETFVVDRSGIIRYRHAGPIMPQDWKRIFQPLLAELRK